ncbi:PIN domain-containing protein [Saccharopolyspora sp. 5N708]|uniref:PIN domain-containing protein n=1 Tax=Saccharopolyspora sp. 5N708 TaxID=3457424 RepID=UPI003FD269FA
MNQALTFVDTNILIYAHDTRDLNKHRTAASIVRDLWEPDSGVLSTQVLQEFHNAATRKRKSRWPVGKHVNGWRTTANGAPSRRMPC